MKPDIKEQKTESPRDYKLIRDYAIVAALLLITFVTGYFFPATGTRIFQVSREYFVELLVILPAVMVILGLINVWISKDVVMKHLGEESGLKGAFFSMLLGTFPTGPLFVAFPIVAALRKKGASMGNIVVLLSAWACIKIPQELIELQFLGFKFMAARLFLTVIFVLLMGWTVDLIIGTTERRSSHARSDRPQ